METIETMKTFAVFLHLIQYLKEKKNKSQKSETGNVKRVGHTHVTAESTVTMAPLLRRSALRVFSPKNQTPVPVPVPVPSCDELSFLRKRSASSTASSRTVHPHAYSSRVRRLRRHHSLLVCLARAPALAPASAPAPATPFS